VASGWHLTVSLYAMLGLVFLAMMCFAAIALRSMRPSTRRPRLAAQLARYGPAGAAPRTDAADGESKLAQSAVSLMSRAISSGDTESKLAVRLDQAGISRQPAEWALLGVCAAIVLAGAFTLLFRNPLLGVPLGVLAGWAVVRVTLTERIRRRRAAFDEQLPNVLQLIAGSLQSGFSLPQALDAVVRENTQPASGEFSRALAETRLGVELPDALVGVASRMESVDLRWVIMAIRIQHETGGNLAEVLRNTVATMRERGYLRRQVRTLSAEGRLSAYVLLALPVGVGGWLFYSDPAYMRPLYATAYGLTMLIGAVVLVTVGAFWMRNLIRVEV
jgi:tight adherence protein B